MFFSSCHQKFPDNPLKADIPSFLVIVWYYTVTRKNHIKKCIHGFMNLINQQDEENPMLSSRQRSGWAIYFLINIWSLNTWIGLYLNWKIMGSGGSEMYIHISHSCHLFVSRYISLQPWQSQRPVSHLIADLIYCLHIAQPILTCDMWHMTCDMWHVTSDMWHVTCDTWHVVNILSKFQFPSSYGLGFMMLWRYRGKGWLN